SPHDRRPDEEPSQAVARGGDPEQPRQAEGRADGPADERTHDRPDADRRSGGDALGRGLDRPRHRARDPGHRPDVDEREPETPEDRRGHDLLGGRREGAGQRTERVRERADDDQPLRSEPPSQTGKRQHQGDLDEGSEREDRGDHRRGATAAPVANATTMNAADPHARACPNRSRPPMIRTTRLSTIGMIPANVEATMAIATDRTSGDADRPRSAVAAAHSRPATRIGPRASPTPSARAPHVGAARRLTVAWSARSAPTPPTSRPRE